MPPDDVLTETIRLQKRVQELEGQLSELAEGPPPGSERLVQGPDNVGLVFNVTHQKEGQKVGKSKAVTVTSTYDDVLRGIAKVLLESPSENQITSLLTSTFLDSLQSLGVGIGDSVSVSQETMEHLRIQFRALGVVTQTKETKERKMISGMKSFSSGSYSFFRWILTPYGDRVVTQLLAKRRDS